MNDTLPPPAQTAAINQTFVFDDDNPALVQILRHLRRGKCCQVLGPRHHKKSHLIQDAASRLVQAGVHHIAYLDLANAGSADVAGFFDNLAARALATMPPGLSPLNPEPCRNADDFRLTLVRLTKTSDRNLLLLVDHLEIAPPNWVALLLSALRAAYVTADSGSRVQSVVCGSLLLSQVAMRDSDRYESIAPAVIVGDLSRAESRRLLNYYLDRRGLIITDDAAQKLLDRIGGDPLLIAEAAEICIASTAGQRYAVVDNAEGVWELLRRGGGHPRGQHPGIEERLRHIENDGRLLDTARRLLAPNEAPVKIANDSELRLLLEMSGLLVDRDGYYQIKSPAWKHLLQERLETGRVGRMFARAGNWRQAIDLLAQATGDAGASEHDYRLDLFTAITNAIHASRTENEAFTALSSGLRSAFPRRDLLVYALDRQERALKLVTALDDQRTSLFQPINLGRTGQPEVQACAETAEYSTDTVSSGETRLLYPLRSSTKEGDPLGLITAMEGLASQPGLSSWEERELMLHLLRNAAQAIKTKLEYLDQLRYAQLQAQILNRLERISSLLHDPDLPEEVVWSVMMEVVTHGHGLGFNRAAFFVPDGDNGVVARFAVGYSTKADAEKYWQTHPFTRVSPDDWVNGLLARHKRPSKAQGLAKALTGLPVQRDGNDNRLWRCLNDMKSYHAHIFDEPPPLPAEFADSIRPAGECVLVPLRAGSELLGVVYADCKFSGEIIPGERFVMLQNFTQQIALIVKNDRTLATERRLHELEKIELRQIDQDLQDLKTLQRALRANLDTTVSGPLRDAIQSELAKVRHQTEAEWAWLVRVRPRDEWQISICDKDDHFSQSELIPAPPDFACTPAEEMKPRIIPAEDARALGLPAYLGANPGDLLVAPVEVNNNCQGILYLELKAGSEIANREKMAERAANRLGVVIEQVQNGRVMQRLVAISLRLMDNDPLQFTLPNMVNEAMAVLRGVSVVSIYAKDVQGVIVLAAHQGVRYPDQMRTHPPYDSTVIAKVVDREKPIYVPDVNSATNEIDFQTSKFVKREKIRSVAAFPLFAEGQHLGCMMFSYRRPHVFPDIEMSALSLFAQLAAAEVLYDSKDRELKQKRDLELFKMRATIGNEFIHDVTKYVPGMADIIIEVEDAIHKGHDTEALKRLRRLHAKVDNLERLSTSLEERLATQYQMQSDVKREYWRIDELVLSTVSRLEEQAPGHVRLSIHDELPPIYCFIDKLLIEKAIDHLVTNAWEAIPKDRMGQVKVSVYREGNWIRIEVRDNGRGISVAERPLIFDPGFSTKNGGGRGQGLFISKIIAELHYGYLREVRQEEQGSTFRLELPIPDVGEFGQDNLGYVGEAAPHPLAS